MKRHPNSNGLLTWRNTIELTDVRWIQVKAPADRAIPEVLSYGLTTVFRPMSGAIAALAAYAFLQAGAIGTESPSAAYAVAFAAGFSERIVARAAESIST